MARSQHRVALTLLCAAWISSYACAQVQTEVPPVIPNAKPVAVEHIKVHGTALENNLEGDAVEREVLVFLPPSYSKEKSRRYPVVYALHGYSIGAEQWSGEIHVPQTIEGAFARGAHEMIVVLPDSKTAHNGSMYSSSVTTGDFEKFIARDIVQYIDAHYRTIPERTSRGLAGHSMGGYGATRIGMKHPDVFGSLYIMSPCCLSAREVGQGALDLEKAVQAMKVPTDSASLPFFSRAQLASAAAWSPNPNHPPSTSTCRPAMEYHNRTCWPDGRPTHRSRCSTSMWATCASIGRSRWMLAIRTAYGRTQPNSTTIWIDTRSRTPSRCTRALTPAPWRTASKIM